MALKSTAPLVLLLNLVIAVITSSPGVPPVRFPFVSVTSTVSAPTQPPRVILNLRSAAAVPLAPVTTMELAVLVVSVASNPEVALPRAAPENEVPPAAVKVSVLAAATPVTAAGFVQVKLTAVAWRDVSVHTVAACAPGATANAAAVARPSPAASPAVLVRICIASASCFGYSA